VPSYSGGAGIEYGFSDKFAPRVGFAYDVKGDGKWKAYGSFGWFYDVMKLSLPISSFGGDKWIDYFYALDTYDIYAMKCDPANDGYAGRCSPGTLYESYDYRFNSSIEDPRSPTTSAARRITRSMPSIRTRRTSSPWVSTTS